MDGFRDHYSERQGAQRGMDRDFGDNGGREYSDRGRYERDYNGRDYSDRDYNERDRYERDYNDRGRRPSDSMGADQLESIVASANSRQLRTLQNILEDAKDERRSAEKEILKSVSEGNSRIESLIGSKEAAVTPGLSPDEAARAKDELMQAILNNSEALNLLKASLIKDVPADEAPAAEDDQTLTRAFVEELFSGLEDHVHKENVKCYRNVQAALESQDKIGAGSADGGLTLVKILSIVSVALSVVNIALLACYVFGVI